MALMETVFVRDYPEERLADEYQKLATSVMAQVGDDPQRLVAEAGALWNGKRDLAGAIARTLRLASHIPDLAITLLRILGDASRESDGKHVPEMRQLYAVLSQNAQMRVLALGNWGLALVEQARTKTGEEAGHFLQEARQKLLEAERMGAGSGAYHLACVEAIEGNTREAVRWLQVFKSTEAPLSKARIAAEKDFDRVRNQPEFVSLLEP
jgi:hypothetical protein